MKIENVSTPRTLKLANGGATAAPISPGVWRVEATPGCRLHLDTMFVESNDAFYTPLEDGIALLHDAFEWPGVDRVLRVTITPTPLAESQEHSKPNG